MTSRASCIALARVHVEARPARRARATASTSAIGQVGAGQDDVASARPTVRVEVRDLRLSHRAEDSRLCCRPRRPSHRHEVRVLAFIDQIVIPFLNSLYGAVGYLGVHGRDGDRVGDDPAALGADPAVRRLPRLRPDARSSRSPARPWNFWIVVIVGDDRQHARVARRLRHRGVRRPAVPRALRQVPADPAARDRAGRPVLRSSTARRRCSSAGCCRSSGRSSASRPAWPGCRSAVHRLLDGRRVPLVDAARLRRHGARRELGRHPPRAPAVRPGDRGRRSSLAVVLFIWWRLGMPGRPGRGGERAAEPPPSRLRSRASLLGRLDRAGTSR